MKQFLPYLTNDQGKSLAVENGVVVTKALPDPLDQSPQGWDNNTVQFSRNNEFRGVIKSYTTALKFFLDGAKILRDAFYRKGIEAVLYFIWQKQNLSFGAGMKFEGWYKGEPDFSTFKDSYDGVEINITEGGFHRQLQANKSVPYEKDFTDEEHVSLYHDGQDIDQVTRYAILPTIEATPGLVGFDHIVKTVPAIILQKEGISGTIVTLEQDREEFPNEAAYVDSSYNCLARNTSDSSWSVRTAGTLSFTCETHVGTPQVSFYLKSSANPTGTYIIQDQLITAGNTYTFNFDITISLVAGARLFLIASFNLGTGEDAIIKYKDTSTFNISFTSRFAPTVFKCFRVFDVGNHLVKQISDNQCTLSSPLLENDENLLIASGDSIRNIPGAKVKTKFTDYHKSVDAVKCIGMQIINNNPVIKSRYDLFTDTTISDLGECRNFNLEPAIDQMYDTVQCGFPNQENNNYDNINGKYEVNTTHIYKAPLSRVKNTYDAVSVYRADPSGIEALRINLEGKTTTDNKGDNDVFFIDAEKAYADYTGSIVITESPSKFTIQITGLSVPAGARFRMTSGINTGYYTVVSAAEVVGTTEMIVSENVSAESITTTLEWRHYKLRRLVYTSITGIPNGDSVFNFELRPEVIIQPHLRWIRSGLDHLDTKKLVFQTTDKNADLVTVRNGVTLVKNADLYISQMGARVYLPYYLTAEFESPENLLALMAADSTGHFDFTMEGVALEGFPMDIKTSETYLETQEYKLLCSPNVNLLNLINNR